jgi:hypothetical protein
MGISVLGEFGDRDLGQTRPLAVSASYGMWQARGRRACSRRWRRRERVSSFDSSERGVRDGGSVIDERHAPANRAGNR